MPIDLAVSEQRTITQIAVTEVILRVPHEFDDVVDNKFKIDRSNIVIDATIESYYDNGTIEVGRKRGSIDDILSLDPADRAKIREFYRLVEAELQSRGKIPSGTTEDI